jgi:hypothetical protein
MTPGALAGRCAHDGAAGGSAGPAEVPGLREAVGADGALGGDRLRLLDIDLPRDCHDHRAGTPGPVTGWKVTVARVGSRPGFDAKTWG